MAKRKRKIKVFGWRGWRHECPVGTNGVDKSTRDVVATTSKKRARELSYPDQPNMRPPLLEIRETGHEDEVAQAMSNPGVVFWHPLDERSEDRKWRKARG